MSTIFDQMYNRYTINTRDDERNAIHEIMQEVTLAAMYREGFFNHAAFYGGTCLRVFHGIKRFLEDMDFSLLRNDESFTLESYFDSIIKEFAAIGRRVDIEKKDKKHFSAIESAFLKDNTEVYDLAFKTEKTVKVKIEIDKNPPLHFDTEHRLLLLPFSFMTRCFSIPCLYAGKMHAFLFRKWKNRVKGRDWYDFEWYVRNNHPLDFNHLKERALQSGNINNTAFTREIFISLLKDRIRKTNIEMVKADVLPFIEDPDTLSIWSSDYFMQLTDMIRFR
ncbi:MAG: nucleotidyl transferase AbiEii/AbiGii toxin family protein [Bacteroidota bacterium]